MEGFLASILNCGGAKVICIFLKHNGCNFAQFYSQFTSIYILFFFLTTIMIKYSIKSGRSQVLKEKKNKGGTSRASNDFEAPFFVVHSGSSRDKKKPLIDGEVKISRNVSLWVCKLVQKVFTNLTPFLKNCEIVEQKSQSWGAMRYASKVLQAQWEGKKRGDILTKGETNFYTPSTTQIIFSVGQLNFEWEREKKKPFDSWKIFHYILWVKGETQFIHYIIQRFFWA